MPEQSTDYRRLENVAALAVAMALSHHYLSFHAHHWDQIGGSAGFHQLAVAAGEALTAYETEHPEWWEAGGDWLIAVDALADSIMEHGPRGADNLRTWVELAVAGSRS